jgi:hypothetical protein
MSPAGHRFSCDPPRLAHDSVPLASQIAGTVAEGKN